MPALDAIRQQIRANYLPDEDQAVKALAEASGLSAEDRRAISAHAADLVRAVRGSSDPRLMEVFLSAYGLSTKEGVALMCLAEALLRVPDTETMDDLIADKIAPHDWSAHSGGSSSIFVNASTWALMLTGRVLDEGEGGIEGTLRAMVRRLGEPVIRKAVAAAMREMGEQFVLGRTIAEAVKRGRPMTQKGYLYSFDMLGEAARTEADALRYHKAYADAISSLDAGSNGPDIRHNHGISVKLSALHPRYEEAQKEEMLPVMAERLLSLALAARHSRMGLNIDAEEADRLDLSLDVIERVLAEPELAGWNGFGVVVQAYGPRAAFVIDWLYALATKCDRTIMVRLVKGAYWDTEIKRAQTLGLAGYPVFTRKVNTDVSYLACARKLLSMTDRIYPQFATHNAHTVAAILSMTKNRESFEFQRLHGMGEALHETVRKAEGTRCRIYAPVGAHSDLLAYLVRRLLENGANSSFVHQLTDEDVEPEDIARDPLEAVESQGPAANPAIPRPAVIFGASRRNSKGFDITDPVTLAAIDKERTAFAGPNRWHAKPITRAAGYGEQRPVVNPARPSEVVGMVSEATAKQAATAVRIAVEAQPAWAKRPVAERAAILNRAADLYEANAVEFFALATREAGKSLADGVAEVREAVDFLRYYAAEAANAEAGTEARGVIVCISPWNFPLAIFTGQIAAALVTGNSVIAKPAEQTPLIAFRAVEMLREAGVPEDVIQLLPGDGPSVGGPLTSDPRIAGVCFTGSTEVAKLIEKQLAETAAPDAMLIAETGGLNAMIVDSTALPEQAVRDILASAFQSAGQRCSALRILYVQKDVEKKMLEMLKGAMEALKVGDPWAISTDVGPVIDDEAQGSIRDYCTTMGLQGRLIAKLEAPKDGRFVAPHVFRVKGIEEMEREVFGPVLHVASFDVDEIDAVIAAINRKGYGLTFGLHTRIEGRVQHFVDGIHAGNIYVNRNQIGAVVGSQPFGGEGLSGTGPKAGGPHYLRRFRKGPEAGTPVGDGHKVTATELADNLSDPALGGWSTRPDRIAILRKHLRGKGAAAIGAAAAIDFGQVDLPGPTGEANTLSLAPRGRVLCLGPDGDTLLAQTIQALAAGNAVLAVAPGAPAALSALTGKGLPLAAIDGRPDPVEARSLRVDVVAFSGTPEAARIVRKVIAERSGPIVPLVSEVLNPAAYAHERAVCVDTTAAGGNASLLAAA
ncbi:MULTISPECIES: bifunctional proline dehydrogenase/L-glutamate gamma-semialdehyde dehydrogenase PutA [unclassified Mesorhizobium]|uniref:bifunctional proline dehydrogenase/L-glutamate gamma-semialdehyde dehydrogenase PutA n=1 Tax=unclassified Mesorhizobium TaxID=325217 RepID=UPI0011281251|nr:MULTISPECIES: bifunctional proline dehydrogenase/L-glutamate gamma-semialdehyde dehydrogenase PutA [unclassified Mesorhizobium]MBZ9983807.1 bifunctional proline dehydrogenase/L-glutamate gamma-semialdehyde dehydrogenase PutA [Mesorhizobium sp. BR-1-1-8]TPL36687.1 bifunctional proline dehydrogenase/L-glutamate gamma-semialdehyde dehydrogenase PutA [Mesorhizobium sp. B2-4-8]TPL66827.1 bifunctional proline dehydrogenase/L-glutamate gamma-semialdehyde dehydrogenase PutA [Mesorhizobium sp. B2-4-1]